jgi:hypothetical protein
MISLKIFYIAFYKFNYKTLIFLHNHLKTPRENRVKVKYTELITLSYQQVHRRLCMCSLLMSDIFYMLVDVELLFLAFDILLNIQQHYIYTRMCEIVEK